jgi:hypothetical protein
MTMPTISEINKFAASVIADMSEAELDVWEMLSDVERKAIVWQTWIVLHNAKDAA